MSTIGDGSFADRLYEQLAPFQNLAVPGHLWPLCDGIGAMFEEVEQLTAIRDDGLVGYANMLDVNACRSDHLAWLAQFVGAVLQTGFSDAAQRVYVASLPGFNRCRPQTIIDVVKATLTGSQFVDLQERYNGNAWQYAVVTKPSETPNVALTLAAIQSQKPGPDQFIHLLIESATYDWLRGEYATYASLPPAYATYGAISNTTL